VKADLFGAARILAAPTILLAAIVAFVPGRVDLAVRLYALILCAVVLGYAIKALRTAYPPAAPLRSAQRRAARGRRPPSSLARIEDEAALGVAGAFHLHHRLCPRLRSISTGLLAVRRRISLDGDPQATRSVLGDPAWNLVRPNRPPPEDRLARGIPISDLRSVVESLERW
jgi:hypothetical protein